MGNPRKLNMSPGETFEGWETIGETRRPSPHMRGEARIKAWQINLSLSKCVLILEKKQKEKGRFQ